MVGRPRQGAGLTQALGDRRCATADARAWAGSRTRPRAGSRAGTARRARARDVSSRTRISASLSSWSSRFAARRRRPRAPPGRSVRKTDEPPGQVALPVGRLSSRAATTAWTVGGTAARRPARVLARSSMPVVSTMKNGLPPARPRSSRPGRSPSRPPPACRDEVGASSRAAARGARRPGSWRPCPTGPLLEQLGAGRDQHQHPARDVAVRAPRSARSGRASAGAACARPRTPARPVARSASPSTSARNPLARPARTPDSSRRGSASPTSAAAGSSVCASVPGSQTRPTSSRRRSRGVVGRRPRPRCRRLAHHRGHRRERGAVRRGDSARPGRCPPGRARRRTRRRAATCRCPARRGA